MMDETLSAFMDGETAPQEAAALLRSLDSDAALRAAWSRGYWLRETLRGGEAVALDPEFADRVTSALRAEQGETVPITARVVPLAGRHRRLRRSLATLAAAASVAGAVLLVSNPLGEDDLATDSPSAATVAESTPVSRDVAFQAASGSPAAERPVGASPAQAAHWSVSDPEVENQLNGYLLEHNGLARGYGLSGATPSFLRVATYGRGDSQ